MGDSTKLSPAPAQQVDPYRFGWRYVRSKDPMSPEEWEQVPLTRDDVLHPGHEDYVMHGGNHDIICRYLAGALEIAVNGRTGLRVLHDVRIDFGVAGMRPLCPDLIVFENVPGDWVADGTFMVAELGARPLLVIEVTSDSTREHDLSTKVNLYRRAGVPLYAIVDAWPNAEPPRVHLLGYRAIPDGYAWINLDVKERLWLEPVRLWLAGEANLAVCFDEQEQQVPGIRELNRVARQAEARVEELQTLVEDEITARRDAEAKANDAITACRDAETKASEAVTARRDAEAKVASEARERQLADKRAADLGEQLAAVQAELQRLRGTP